MTRWHLFVARWCLFVSSVFINSSHATLRLLQTARVVSTLLHRLVVRPLVIGGDRVNVRFIAIANRYNARAQARIQRARDNIPLISRTISTTVEDLRPPRDG